ncbi:MAG: histidine--tRNA ligase [Candidatus Levybacteria bacterium]|nr:histidine--tRNA ligase [Candidatus Levybacteria bacterium]
MLVQTLKGFRDFLPPQARKRQFVINTLKSVFESYGFEPLETPALEYEEILTGKYGEEGDKLMYRFEDNGGRRVALRYDQTVPLSRVVAQYQNDLPLPFKRYQIQPVWRAENTQKGRFREFLQCDIDTAGTTSPIADAEILVIINDAFETLGFNNFTILVNDRTNFKNFSQKAITSIDKLKKIGRDAVIKELAAENMGAEELDNLIKSDMPSSLQTIVDNAKKLGVLDTRLVYEPTLARGLDYYTGIIIEVEIDGYTVGSVGGGGRYDNLIGMFANKTIPAVGFAFGFDRVMDAMDEKNLFPNTLSSAKVLVTIFSPDLLKESIEAAYKLRAEGIATELYVDQAAKMEKQLKYADDKKIPFALIIGPDEAKNQTFTLKNLESRKQTSCTFPELLSQIS